MERFNLEEWLKDKSRKICTRDGRIVEILKVDAKGNHPIIGIYQFSDTEDMESSWRIDGRKTENGESFLDLFFADEDDEFETTMISFSHAMFDHLLNTNVKVDIKEWKNKLLDLARKEIEKDNIIIDKDKYLKICDQYYNNGKKDALKSLPKWKKTNVFVSDEFGLATRDDDLIITNAGYQIKLSDLKTLPKEE